MLHAVEWDRTENIIFISRSYNKKFLVQVKWRMQKERKRERMKKRVSAVYLPLLGALLDITTSLLAFQDLREPREREVTAGEMDRNEPGGYDIY